MQVPQCSPDVFDFANAKPEVRIFGLAINEGACLSRRLYHVIQLSINVRHGSVRNYRSETLGNLA